MGVNPLDYDVSELRGLPAAALPVERPYLRRLPADPAAREFAVEWLTRLVEVAGVVGAARALEAYREGGWLSDAAADSLQDLLLAAGHGRGSFDDLTREDHLRSLAAIARLAAQAEE